MWTTAGSRKDSVLPLPVWARPMRSRPCSAIGHPCAWMGVGAVKPALRTSASTYSARLAAATAVRENAAPHYAAALRQRLA